MKTSKPFSTISYNSVDFLKYRLDLLVNSGKISFYAFIKHFGEFDPQRNEREKDHIHLFIEPNGTVDTDDILAYFVEIDQSNPTKPFRCLPSHKSKFGDWYLYSIHDKAYLASKFETREYSYQLSDIVTSSSELLDYYRHTIDYSKTRIQNIIIEAATNGVPFSQLVFQGLIPMQLIYAAQRTYDLITQFNSVCYRDKKTGHDDDI